MKNKYKTLLILFILVAIGLILFWPTFRLEIFGDEWEGIWWTTSTWLKTGHFNDRIGYKSYELAAILLTFVSGAFNLSYSSTQVYVFSFLTRLFAVFCLYYFLTKRKLTKIAVFVGCLLFLITPVGIQTTDWAKNFTSYISLGFFILFLDAIWELTSWKKVLLALSMFSLAVYVNPIRAHGIILTATFLLLIQLLFRQPDRQKNIVISLLSLGALIFLFLKISLFGEVGTNKNFYIQSLSGFSSQIFGNTLVKIEELFVLVGRGFLPISNKNWAFILGIGLVFFTAAAFIRAILKRKFSDALILSLIFSLSTFFILMPWFLGHTDITDSIHRYLIYSALTVPIVVALALDRMLPKLKFLSFLASLILLMVFFTSLKSEIDKLYLHHNQKLARTIWQQITPYFDKFDFQSRRAIVFFDADNQAVLHGSVTFGFGYHVGFIYRIWDYDKLPVAVDSMKDLISLITDGKAGQKYIQKEAIFPKEDAFYFKIERGKVTRLPL